MTNEEQAQLLISDAHNSLQKALFLLMCSDYSAWPMNPDGDRRRDELRNLTFNVGEYSEVFELSYDALLGVPDKSSGG